MRGSGRAPSAWAACLLSSMSRPGPSQPLTCRPDARRYDQIEQIARFLGTQVTRSLRESLNRPAASLPVPFNKPNPNAPQAFFTNVDHEILLVLAYLVGKDYSTASGACLSPASPSNSGQGCPSATNAQHLAVHMYCRSNMPALPVPVAEYKHAEAGECILSKGQPLDHWWVQESMREATLGGWLCPASYPAAERRHPRPAPRPSS